MEISPNTLPWQSLYKLLTGAILPRPIGWISTVNPAGQANLAPFSFFNAVCANPPTVLFCPMIRSSDGQPKDTLRNVRATGEFVVNIAAEALIGEVNLTSIECPAEVDEFAFAGLEKAPSAIVRPPRVALSPVNFECRVTQIFDVGEQPGAGSVVIGQVVYIHIREDVLIPPDKINLARLQPIGRLAGAGYVRATDAFELPRPGSWQGK